MFSAIQQELKGKPFLTKKQEIVQRLTDLFKKSVTACVAPQRVAIAFSGGIDSTLLAFLYRQHSTRCVLYTVGLQGSSDLEQAALVAAKMKFPLKLRIISHSEALDIITDVVAAFKLANLERNPMDVAIASVIYAVMLMAQKDNIQEILYGICMDEPFGGYDNHTEYKKNYQKDDIQQRLWKSLHHLESREVSRDQAVAAFANMKLTSPFMNEELVTYAMQIDPLLKVSEEEKKIILRETAVHLGIPKDIAKNKKTAAQYGTGFTEFIKDQAKENGYERSEDFLNSLSE